MADNQQKLVPMPNGGFQVVIPLASRFWSKVAKRSSDECWLWTGYCNKSGYPLIRDGKAMRPAAQIALEISGRPRPPAPNNHALHGDTCIARHCCNEAHLRWGSNAENVADRERLGRNKVPLVRGERQGSAKLTEEKVRQIREAKGRQRDIASQYGVCQMTISLVKSRKVWGHVL